MEVADSAVALPVGRQRVAALREVAGRLVGADVVAAVEIDVGVDRGRQASEVNVVKEPSGGAFALDDRVHVVGVPCHDRAGDQREGGGLGALAVKRLEADAAFVAIEDGVFEREDALSC